MPASFNIQVSKEILEASKKSTSLDDLDIIGQDCPIALALKDIFPDVFVSGHDIFPFGIEENNQSEDLKIPLPKIAKDFIKDFDSLSEMSDSRVLLPEFEFEISIPDEIIRQINIDEIRSSSTVSYTHL